MCGFTFLHSGQLNPDQARQRTVVALNHLTHRGPDGSGIDGGSGWQMGHRRLSIIDIESSSQPMRTADGRYCLGFNGEIYNYRELRRTLEPSWDFKTRGDTEVLLAGLVVHGAAFLNLMEGMWAFAFWDELAQTLILARDRMGKKPLYYKGSRQTLMSASELPALRALDDGPWAEDFDTTADYLRFGYPLPGYTAYQGVREVLPAHFLEWRPGAEPQLQQYWTLVPQPFSGTEHDASVKLREALQRAVERRLVADVEVGAFLSGGIDSSIVCALASKALDRPLRTFTIGFREAAFDERAYASLASRHIGTHHTEEVLGDWDEERLERLLTRHLGQPFADSSILPTAMVSDLASRSVKVALSGDGGDELFSGYERYQARNLLRWYTRLPASLRRSSERLIRALPEPSAHHSRSLLKKAHLFLDIMQRQGAETPYIAPMMFAPQQFAALVPDLLHRGHPPPGIPEHTESDDLARMMVADALVYLPQDILTKVDRASMAHSIEVRAPFLDSEVVHLAFSLPRRWHRKSFKGKLMLRKSFEEMIPATLWNRRKQGFGVPIHAWFRAQLGERLIAMVESDPGPVHAAALKSLLAEHRLGGRDHGYRLWQIYCYLLWRQHG